MAGRRKGTPKTGGRQKGTPNKMTMIAREAIEEAFDRLGGVDNLVRWARENESAFYEKIWPKILPQQIHGKLTLEDLLSEARGNE